MMLSLMLASLLNVFIVESPSYAKQMVVASHQVTSQFPDVRFSIRTTEQVIEMQSGDLKREIENADIVVLGRTYGNVATRIREAFEGVGAPKIVFAAHADFDVYALNRFRTDRPFRNVPREQVDAISSSTLDPERIPQLRRWSRAFQYLLVKGPENVRNLLLDLLSDLDSRFRADPVHASPAAFIYKNGTIYSDAASFDSLILRNRPTVAIIDHDNYYHSGDAELEDRLSLELERSGINALPIFAGSGIPTARALREFVQGTQKDWDIRAIILLQSFIMGGDQAREEVSALFRDVKVPIFRALRLTKRSPEQWLLSADGLPWASVYY